MQLSAVDNFLHLKSAKLKPLVAAFSRFGIVQGEAGGFAQLTVFWRTRHAGNLPRSHEKSSTRSPGQRGMSALRIA